MTGSIILRFVCLIVGYLFGLIETGVLYGKLKGVDIRNYGSGNSGTTNALRVLGTKAGLIVFLGDFLKSLIPCLAVTFIFKNIEPYANIYQLFVLYAGFGAVLGHNFPCYLNFKGGKGIATTAGTIVGLLNGWMILILLILFVAVVAATRYVSLGSIIRRIDPRDTYLGSILLMIEFSILYIIFAFKGMLCFGNFSTPFIKEALIESIILVLLFAAFAIYRHKANIMRLMAHEERKLSFHKEGEIKK